MAKHSPATQLIRQRTGRLNSFLADLSGRNLNSISEILRGDRDWTDWLEAALLEGTDDPDLVAEVKELQRQSRHERLEAQLAKLEASS